jgi:hypothetical protein
MSNSWTPFLSPFFNVRFPASGDVLMDYEPSTNWDVFNPNLGNARLESGIFRDVASPGAQLGKLTDAVTALIEIAKDAQPAAIAQNPDCAKAFDSLCKMRDDIDLKKKELQKSAEAEALDALNRLKTADYDAFKSLVETLHRQSNGTAPDGN